jgi:methyltransferase
VTLPLVLFALAFVPMALESRRSRANERGLRAQGAREPEGDVYPAMQVAYPSCFLAMVLEAWLRGRTFTGVFAAGAVVFAAAKALKYWAIASLGPRWAFRVLVPPGSALVASGPYRHMRHPNYVGVAGEMVGMALMSQAPIAGSAAALGFAALLLARIRVEERALEVHSARNDRPRV